LSKALTGGVVVAWAAVEGRGTARWLATRRLQGLRGTTLWFRL